MLSTIKGMPASRATFARESRSATRSKGFERVSAKISFVVGFNSDLSEPSVRRVEHVVTDPPPRELAGHQRGRLAIDAVGNEEVIVLAEECQKNRGDRSHARSTDQARPQPPSRRASLSASWAALGCASRA